MSVYLLWDYGDLVGVYADRETAEADRQVLLAQDRADRDAGQWRVTREYHEPRIVVDEVTPRTAPRFSP